MAEGYDEDGGATISDLAGLYRCVREMVAERDRLREVLAGIVWWILLDHALDPRHPENSTETDDG
jgi:hypothetical protein